MPSESAWRTWLASQELPAVTPATGGRIVVFSAHPDDEILGLGGLLSGLAQSSLVFCTATDGEASHPNSRTLSPPQMAQRRRTELFDALHELGLSSPEVDFLALPDSGLTEHREKLATAAHAHIAEADLVLCPWRNDGHADHEVVGEIVTDLGRGRVPVWQYPIWLWEWTVPGEHAAPWADACTIGLDHTSQHRKRAAIGRFLTQIESLSSDPADNPVLPSTVLAHFDRPYELVFT